jgi:hypothetical protein
MIQVVNVRDYPTTYPTPYIYVGRYMPGLFKGHPLANPFKLSRKAADAERVACLEKYRQWVRTVPDWEDRVRELGERCRRLRLPLGCWCAPKLCHATVLAELIEEVLGPEGAA